MKTYTTIKITVLTLVLTAAGFGFAEKPAPCQDCPNPECEQLGEMPFEPGPPEEHRRMDNMRRGPEHRPHGKMDERRRRDEHGPQAKMAEKGRRRENEMRRRGMAAMEWLKGKDPEKFEKLNKLHHSDNRAFFKEMRGVMKDFMKEKNPEMFKMKEQHQKTDQKIKKLLKRYKNAKDPEKKNEIAAKLKAALGKQFELKQEFKSKEIKKLERRTNNLKKSLETRQQNKVSIVETKFKELTNGKESVEW